MMEASRLTPREPSPAANPENAATAAEKSTAPTSSAPARLRSVALHPGAEPLIFTGGILAYLWAIRPLGFAVVNAAFLAALTCMPFVSSFLHGDSFRDVGLRLDNLGASAREVAPMTLGGAALILAIGAAAGNDFHLAELPRWMSSYPIWALAQQYALQGFVYRRLRGAGCRPRQSILAAAALLAAVHLPNPSLTAATLAGGLAWCSLYERRPNLLTLALSHGWLAALLAVAWPASWLHDLMIGPSYWSWTP